MESTITLRAFSTDHPSDSATWGRIAAPNLDTLSWTDPTDPTTDALTDPDAARDEWVFHDDFGDAPDAFTNAFQQYAREELSAFGTDKPARQRVFNDDVVVVLDSVFFRVTDGEIQCEYEYSTGKDMTDGSVLCQGKFDADTGIVAEAIHDDDKIAAAFQRCCDALDSRVEWTRPVSPRGFNEIVETAMDMTDDDE